MIYDRQLALSVGNSRKSIQWVPYKVSVADFYQRLATPLRGSETLSAYLAMKKGQQDELKDVGGFVGGQLSGPRRKASAVLSRDLVTLDYDSLPPHSTEKLLAAVNGLGFGYCVYSTRKHRPEMPRLRIVLPSSRSMSPEEHEACARRIADKIGIQWVDPSTFESCRLMYWPSVCADGEYIYRTKDAPFFDVDAVLGWYENWHDQTQWPQVPGAVNIPRLSAKQGDPLEKTGTVGAFCRVYDVPAAMDKFLPGVYEMAAGYSDRYTFTGGSTTGGAVLYEDGKFLYSHHATDPCGGKLVNAFDLVRLHLFGDLDDQSNPDIAHSKLPSYLKMCEFAIKDEAVTGELTRERLEAVKNDFGDLTALDIPPAVIDVPAPSEGPLAAVKRSLRYNSQTGKPAGTINNVRIILETDPYLAGQIARSSFQERAVALGPLPWNKEKVKGTRPWEDNDMAGLYWYLENYYDVTKRSAIDSAFSIVTKDHEFNEVKDYLNPLIWDGVPRLDTIFIDYLGAQDTLFNRTVTRKMMVAAVARVMDPGCKFDNMLILIGEQGINKSMFLRILAKDWIDDSFTTFEGKESQERLPGSWFVEVAELDAFRKSDVARIKQFLSNKEDKFRPAYGRYVLIVPRRCVFWGTGNTVEFLRDETGNRRFWPVDIGDGSTRTKDPTKISAYELDQIWAEAKARYMLGEELYLPKELQGEAERLQREHMVSDAREGVILDFVNQKVPKDWANWPLDRRRDFWALGANGEDLELVERDRISAHDIWCERFNRPLEDIQRELKSINAILQKMKGWKKQAIRNGPYGMVLGFVIKH